MIIATEQSVALRYLYSVYFKWIVLVFVLVLLPLDTDVVIRKFPLVVVLAFVVIRIFFVRISITTFLIF